MSETPGTFRPRTPPCPSPGRARCRLLAWLLAPALLLPPARAEAQRSEFTIELRPFGAAFGYAQRILPGVYLGLAVGGGIDVLDRTFAPDPADEAFHAFEQLLHAAAFLRQKPTDRIDLDIGLRAGIGGVHECTSSDCSPGGFVGLHASAFWGRPRLKVGPRVLWGVARYGGQADAIVYAELLTVRFTF